MLFYKNKTTTFPLEDSRLPPLGNDPIFYYGPGYRHTALAPECSLARLASPEGCFYKKRPRYKTRADIRGARQKLTDLRQARKQVFLLFGQRARHVYGQRNVQAAFAV